MLTLDAATARRFILGKQGLWPGRRWQGEAGVRQALQSIEHLQLDPLNVAGRAHDLILQARVAGYRPEQLDQVAYAERAAFDWGDWLALRPMAELPFYRVNMARRARLPRYAAIAREHRATIDWVRREIERQGPLRNRDLAGFARVESYRARKDTGLALFYLWIKGEVMTSARPRFERLYDLAERVAPKAALTAADAATAERFHALKLVSFQGIGRVNRLAHWIDRAVTGAAANQLAKRLVKAGELVPVKINAPGWSGDQYVRAGDAEALETVAHGRVPRAWEPLDQGAAPRVTFLSPLDVVSARGRAARLFGFDYVWEVYKPEAMRIWGYYVLPVLWGDQLVARLDARKNAAADCLEVLGFWPEAPQTLGDRAFGRAFREAFTDFLGYLDVSGVKARGPGARALRLLLGA